VRKERRGTFFFEAFATPGGPPFGENRSTYLIDDDRIQRAGTRRRYVVQELAISSKPAHHPPPWGSLSGRSRSVDKNRRRENNEGVIHDRNLLRESSVGRHTNLKRGIRRRGKRISVHNTQSGLLKKKGYAESGTLMCTSPQISPGTLMWKGDEDYVGVKKKEEG